MSSLKFDGSNAGEVIHLMSDAGHALRGGVHPGAPGEHPTIKVDLSDGRTLEIRVGDTITVDARGVIHAAAH